jgi:hypothetical protein
VNPKHKDWQFYGGRGIRLCEEWQDFGIFQAWALANGYQEGLEVDRIDNEEGYGPGNVRFVSHAQNSRNRRSTLLISLFGETKSLKEWFRDPHCRVSYQVLRYHYWKGDNLSRYFAE